LAAATAAGDRPSSPATDYQPRQIVLSFPLFFLSSFLSFLFSFFPLFFLSSFLSFFLSVTALSACEHILLQWNPPCGAVEMATVTSVPVLLFKMRWIFFFTCALSEKKSTHSFSSLSAPCHARLVQHQINAASACTAGYVS